MRMDEITTNEDLVPLPPTDDPRYMLVAQSLVVGYTPAEAVVQASLPLPDFSPTNQSPDQKLSDDDYDAIRDYVNHPQVKQLTQALLSSNESAFTLKSEEVRAYLRAVITTPISLVTPESPLCQSYKRQDTKFGETVEVKMPDKLKALDMDNKLQGRYAPQDLSIGPNETLLEMMNEARDKKSSLP